ncbi:MAG: transglycosylase SLT domain-containing protein [Gammaproteobacteria bacterium]|nr:transglycosylase SLT domain-containing protein [Gammaproteobacteria bacterium]
MESIVVAAATGRVRALGGSLTEAEVRAVLVVAGWPVEPHGAALAVSWCESKWSPNAVGDGGASVGLFQTNVATWFPYAGEDPEMWADPLTNARVAWAVMGYDRSRGYERWRQWSCKP